MPTPTPIPLPRPHAHVHASCPCLARYTLIPVPSTYLTPIYRRLYQPPPPLEEDGGGAGNGEGEGEGRGVADGAADGLRDASGSHSAKRRRAWTVAEEDSFLMGVSKHGMAWQQVARDDGLHPQLKLRCLSSHTALADKYKSITMGKNEDLKERLRLACRAHATEVALTPNSDRNPNPNPHPNSDPDPDRTLDPDPPPLEEGRLHEASGSHNEEDKEREEPTNILTD